MEPQTPYEEVIKEYLIKEFGEDTWEDFVDSQEIGDCQAIVSFIVKDFPIAKKVFGEIEVDEPYCDESGREQILMTHHWITINGVPYDFSKGTLKNYIDFFDIYDPAIYELERYN